MSVTASHYAQFILEKHFGPSATIVTRLMRIKGPVILLEILRDCSFLGVPLVARCLRSMLRHMTVVIKEQNIVKYELNYPYIFSIPRYPYFCQLVLHFYGPVAEELMSLSFILGRTTVFDLLKHCISRHFSSVVECEAEHHKYVDLLCASFDTLLRTGVARVSTGGLSTTSEVTEADSSSVPDGVSEWPFSKEAFSEELHRMVSIGFENTSKNANDDAPGSKRRRISADQNPSAKAAWVMVMIPHLPTLEAMWRDRLIFNLAEDRVGTACADILSRLLCIATAARRNTEITSHESGAVSRSELMRSLRDQTGYFDSHVTLLKDDEVPFVVQEPGLGGYMYKCPYQRVIKELLIKHAEHVVQVLFLSSGLRIFRLLLSSGPLHYEEIERRVLLPQKDFRRTLPKMIAEGFISTTELSRTKEYTAETIFCFYSVNLPRIAQLLVELAQHAALRVGLRGNQEFDQKKRLIDHRYRVETLIERHHSKLCGLKAQLDECTEDESLTNLMNQQKESLDALKASVTPTEQQQMKSLLSKMAKLVICEHEAHTTWFVADLYLKLQVNQ